jgi:hypothetical protein
MTIALPSSRLFLVFLASMTGGHTLGWAQPASEGTPPAVLIQQAPAPALPGLAAPAAATASQNLPARSPLPSASAASSRAFTPAAASPVAPPKAWNELSAPQQQALKPLATNWNSIDEPQKRKWLAVSKNFSSMTPAEQAKLHSRMSEWAALSPKQRTQARLNFGETTQVPAEEKRATWEAYQALSPEEKRKLAAGAPTRPSGAAPALKPVPATKLATTPIANPPRGGASGTSLAAARAASAPRQIDQKTLLPRKVTSAP